MKKRYFALALIALVSVGLLVAAYVPGLIRSEVKTNTECRALKVESHNDSGVDEAFSIPSMVLPGVESHNDSGVNEVDTATIIACLGEKKQDIVMAQQNVADSAQLSSSTKSNVDAILGEAIATIDGVQTDLTNGVPIDYLTLQLDLGIVLSKLLIEIRETADNADEVAALRDALKPATRDFNRGGMAGSSEFKRGGYFDGLYKSHPVPHDVDWAEIRAELDAAKSSLSEIDGLSANQLQELQSLMDEAKALVSSVEADAADGEIVPAEYLEIMSAIMQKARATIIGLDDTVREEVFALFTSLKGILDDDHKFRGDKYGRNRGGFGDEKNEPYRVPSDMEWTEIRADLDAGKNALSEIDGLSAEQLQELRGFGAVLNESYPVPSDVDWTEIRADLDAATNAFSEIDELSADQLQELQSFMDEAKAVVFTLEADAADGEIVPADYLKTAIEGLDSPTTIREVFALFTSLKGIFDDEYKFHGGMRDGFREEWDFEVESDGNVTYAEGMEMLLEFIDGSPGGGVKIEQGMAYVEGVALNPVDEWGEIETKKLAASQAASQIERPGCGFAHPKPEATVNF